MKIVVLGSGGSAESANRACSSYLVNSEIVIDAGPGSYKNFLRYGGNPLKIKYFLISHLHGDHFFDIGAFFWGMSYQGRTEPVTVIGPKGVKEAFDSLIKFANTPKTFMRFDVQYTEIEPGKNLKLDSLKLSTESGKHSVQDIAYRVGPLCYTGDTSPNESIVRLCKKASLLIHESSGFAENEEYLNSVGHSSARQAATEALQASVKKLLLTHIPPSISNYIAKMKAEAVKLFRETIIAKDLLELEI